MHLATPGAESIHFRQAVAFTSGWDAGESEMTDQTLTGTIETDVEPDVIFAFLVNPKLIPRWAPVFADRVEADGPNGWRVTKDGSTFSLRLAVSESSRTVDYLREIAPGRHGGAYLRVLPRLNGGSVVLMTLPVPPGANVENVGLVLGQELETLVCLCKEESLQNQ